MRFYQQQHQYYCGVDLRARSMYTAVLRHHYCVILHLGSDCWRSFNLVFFAICHR